MPKKNPTLAKLSRPRLYDALPRRRLFDLLDEKRKHSVVWVVGPPGAGKTTLVGSYVEARGMPALWYQVDAGDRDVSSFFFFLGQAVPGFSNKKTSLPDASPDVLQNLDLFSRRYFREFFACVPHGGVIVIDNFQEAADSADFEAVIDFAIAEIPSDRSLVVISRTDPPPMFSRRLAGQEIAVVGWEALRLTIEETEAIMANAGLELDRVRALYEQADGWAAGVVLMREGMSPAANTRIQDLGGSREGLFHYFASQIFDRVDADTQNVMMRTAFLPFVTPESARELSGNEKAADIVEHLYRRHFFVNRRNDGSYQYHALFREFLRNRAQTALRPDGLHALLEHAGRLLFSAGDIEASFELQVRAQAWETARRISVAQAPELLKHGRWQTLIGWLDALREEDFDVDPWLTYWRGLAEMSTDALRARATLERAYCQFAAAKNRTGELHSVSRILDTYFLIWNTVSSMDPWIAAAEKLIRDDRPVANEAQTRSYASLLIALLYRQPCNPLLHVAAKKVENDLEAELDPTQKLRMIAYLMHYYDLMGEFSRTKRLIRISEALRSAERVAPLVRAVTWMRCAQHFEMTGEHEHAMQCSDTALNIAQVHGLADSMVGFVLLSCAHVRLGAGLVQEAASDLREARDRINPANRMINVYAYWLEFWLAVRQGDRSRARGLWEAFAKVPPVGVPFNTAYNLPVACHLADEGRHGELRERIERWRAGLAGMGSAFIDFNLDLMGAYAEYRANNEGKAEPLLRRAFGIAAARGFENTLAWVPSMMSALCALALTHGIEPEYVRRLIRIRDLSAPDPTLESWPWSVRVYALGRFAVLKDGKPLVFSGRPQHRTLELLKAIIAFGGRAVSVARVTAALWPDAEGDAAQRAFAVALHRLRRLLESDRAIQLNDGLLSLDRQWCWVDALAFEDFADGGGDADKVDSDTVTARLMGLYRGHLLGEEEAAWLLPHKERLRTKFQRAVRRLGDVLESRNEWERAADLYRRAIEMDSLSEDFYRRIMACRSRQGRYAEAMETYRRCREMLSIVLGVAPSADTQALFRSIQAAGAVGATDPS